MTFGTSSKQFPPPPIPADIRVCFEQIVAAPKKGAMTKKQVLALIASLKLSEAQKVACGKRLIAFYEAFSHKDK